MVQERTTPEKETFQCVQTLRKFFSCASVTAFLVPLPCLHWFSSVLLFWPEQKVFNDDN